MLSHKTYTHTDILSCVWSPNGRGVYASADKLYKGAVFGRDSLEVAEDIMSYKPELAREILLTLASLQGLVYNESNEEEPGRIHHEYREAYINGQVLDPDSQAIFDALSPRWGGTNKELRYYGSVDATPLFIRTCLRFYRDHDTEFLQTSVTRYDGSITTISSVVLHALDWMRRNIAKSRHHMVSYKSSNPHGIENQVWKDSKEFYVHADGIGVNHDEEIASIEVQGLAYDALAMASKCITNLPYDALAEALVLRDRVLDMLWMPDVQYFALGLDVAMSGTSRMIKTITANPAALLDTMIFDDLPEDEYKKYVCAIARTIVSPEFLTDAGIRSRALSQADVCQFWDYHGSLVTWPKETFDIAKGMRRHGMPRIAKQLENRLKNVIRRAGDYPEFIYVNESGDVLYAPAMSEGATTHHVNGTNHPERMQAWTLSAAYALSHTPPKAIKSYSWTDEVEADLLGSFADIPHVTSVDDLDRYYPQHTHMVSLLNPQSAQAFFAHTF